MRYYSVTIATTHRLGHPSYPRSSTDIWVKADSASDAVQLVMPVVGVRSFIDGITDKGPALNWDGTDDQPAVIDPQE